MTGLEVFSPEILLPRVLTRGQVGRHLIFLGLIKKPNRDYHRIFRSPNPHGFLSRGRRNNLDTLLDEIIRPYDFLAEGNRPNFFSTKITDSSAQKHSRNLARRFEEGNQSEVTPW